MFSSYYFSLNPLQPFVLFINSASQAQVCKDSTMELALFSCIISQQADSVSVNHDSRVYSSPLLDLYAAAFV
jgi:hypothetical protein